MDEVVEVQGFEQFEPPPQTIAANASSVVYDPETVGRDQRGRICGHTISITINRGSDFCCENCRKDYERLPEKTRSRLQRALRQNETAAASVPLAFERMVARNRLKDKENN